MMRNTMLFTGLIFINHAVAQNIGINISNPAYRLTVGADALNKGIAQKTGTVEVGFFTSTGSAYVQTWSNHPLLFTTNNSSPQMTIAANGNVGIGTTSPTAKLDVGGSLRIRGGNPQPGYVLKATDANGNTAWQPPPAKKTIVQYISHPAFLPYNSFSEYSTVIPGVSRRPNVEFGGNTSFLAPLQLPVGAVIKGITWYFGDQSETKNMTFYLVRDNLNGEEPEVVSQVTSSGAVSGQGTRTLVAPLNYEINEKFHWLRVSVFAWPIDYNLLIHGAKITYEL